MISLPSSVAAGLLLAAIPVLQHHHLPAPTAAAVLLALGAARTTAYKVKGELESVLPELLRPPGRPQKPPDTGSVEVQLALAQRVRDFFFDHPGCVSGS